MADMTADEIGTLAEAVAAFALARPVGGRGGRALFRATYLGDKYPAVDYLIDVLGEDRQSAGFFFAQVKGTFTPPGAGGRLPVRVDATRYNRMVAIPAPTYLIGVDCGREEAFVVAATEPRPAGVPSVPTAFRLADEAVTIVLADEVLAFWQANRAILQHSRFRDD
jgi:hypothetical protein